jgi:rRNA maturation RNase YbeY
MSTNIQWLTQNVEMPSIDTDLMARWIEAVARSHGRIVGDLTYIFCDDDKIIEVNRQFLNHDYFTDIITFDDTRGRLIRGDLFISLDTVRTNAVAVDATYDDELLRVIIHGILHLCGINDKGPGEREIMETFENQALNMLKNLALDH